MNLRSLWGGELGIGREIQIKTAMSKGCVWNLPELRMLNPTQITIKTPDKRERSKEKPSGSRYWYLYQTNLPEVSLDGFVGSQYFLEQLGTSEQEIYQIFGDAMLEQQVVMDSIRNAFNGGYTQDDITNTNDQMQYLYDNAISEKERIKLRIGEKLSAEQVDLLEKDLIWLVEEEVDGVKVWCPRCTSPS